LAPCSAILKQRPARAWLTEHADPADTVLYVGIDWSETRRIPAIEHGWAPWTVRFPMCDPPLLSKQDMLDTARAEGLTPPRPYELGFSHNNFFWTTTGAAARVCTASLCTLPLMPGEAAAEGRMRQSALRRTQLSTHGRRV
jgi:hypothetical protein